MSDAIESLGRVRIQGIALIVLAFLAGGVAGFASGRLTTPRPRVALTGRVATPEPGRLPPFFDRLDLTADQRARIQAILDSVRPTTDSILHASLPRLQAIADSTHLKIRDVLTPAQRDRLDRAWGRHPMHGFDHAPGMMGGGRGPAESTRTPPPPMPMP